MNPVIRSLVGALLVIASPMPLLAQDAPQPQGPGRGAEAAANAPLQVQIVIARYLNDKRTSSLPFSLSMSSAPNSKANVRMGGSVAVPSTVFNPQTDNTKTLTSYNFQDVGTNIDVTTVPGSGGRIGLTVTISETTLKPADQNAPINVPGRSTYQSQNTVYVKDGETAQFTAATDRISGEVVRIEVTAKVVK